MLQVGTLVKASTLIEPIEPGQATSIDEDGKITNPTGTISPGTPFILTNNCPTTKFAAAVYTIDPTGGQSPAPCFVSQLLHEQFTAAILPTETVVLWFGPHQESGTIIKEPFGHSLTVPYDGVSQHTVVYTADGKWELVN